MGLKGLSDLFLLLAFKSYQFSSFKWLQKDTQFDSNGAKMATFLKKITKTALRQRLRSKHPVSGRREYCQFAQHVAEKKHFSSKKNLWVQAFLNEILVLRLNKDVIKLKVLLSKL